MIELTTARLLIRPFIAADTRVIHRVLDQTFGDGSLADDPAAIAERATWVEWSALSSRWHARLYQPPYGDLAVVLRASETLIGAVGYTPCLDVFGQLPAFGGRSDAPASAEVGLLWAIDPQHQRCGYATEAAQALIDYAFARLRLGRIIATTEHANLASQGVMRRLGMRIEHNPFPEPPWLQVVGIRERG
jgi:[ribosomal protein S5]-alanine N-acetyltransferase